MLKTGGLAEQVEMLEDAIDDGGVLDEGDDAHHARSGRATLWVNRVNFFDEPGPVRLAGAAPRLRRAGLLRPLQFHIGVFC